MKRLKKIIAVILVFCTTITLCAIKPEQAEAYNFTPGFAVNSLAGVLYNVENDQVMYEKNSEQKQNPGHFVQIVTALVVMDKVTDLSATITASSDLYGPLYDYEEVDDIRYANILNGDTLTVEEYLYALMLTSSCEAALILENYVSGNSASFVKLMNDKAEAIGCENTHFTNSTGLYDSQQFTTANDMLKIVNYALENETFKKIATTSEFTVKSSNTQNHSGAWTFTQANSMTQEDSEFYYEGAQGIKTANLDKCGRSIITMCSRDGLTYIVILMNAPFYDEDDDLQYYHIEDATALLDWAFEKFEYRSVFEDDAEMGEVEVLNSNGNNYVLVQPERNCILLWDIDDDISAVATKVVKVDNVMAPVKKGDKLGTVQLKFSGEVIDEIDLVAVDNVKRSFTKFNSYALKNFPHSPWFIRGWIFGLILTALYLVLCIYASKRAKNASRFEKPIHVVPHVKSYQDRRKQDLKKSETVFYHGPEEPKPQPSEAAIRNRDKEEEEFPIAGALPTKSQNPRNRK